MEIKQAVEQRGGKIVAWHGGQEHATPGYEKKEIDRLLADALKQPKSFDAVIVAHADRWSLGDNTKSQHGLKVFEANKILVLCGRS